MLAIDRAEYKVKAVTDYFYLDLREAIITAVQTGGELAELGRNAQTFSADMLCELVRDILTDDADGLDDATVSMLERFVEDSV